MNFDFSNKNIFVGGATDGIGWSCAQSFADLGANVVLVSRNLVKLNTRLQELKNNGRQNHQVLALDYSNHDDLEKLLKDFISKHNLSFDVVINNTGGPAGGKLQSADSVELVNAYNMHLVSFHKILSIVLDGMKSRSYGRIINIISTSVKQPLNGLGVSNTVRGAVANWGKTLANELGADNITVNNVLPGATNTGRLKDIIRAKSNKLNKEEEIIANDMASEVPMKRIANPKEVANAVVFLASSNASYINGINLPVDGGRTKSL